MAKSRRTTAWQRDSCCFFAAMRFFLRKDEPVWKKCRVWREDPLLQPASAMRHRYYMFLCLLMAFSLVTTGYAQDLAFETVSLPSGSAANSIIDIAQDHQGYLWLATYNGLHRYDGYEVRSFRPVVGDSTSLSHRRVESLLVDHTGTLWVGALYAGLNRFDPVTETFTRFQHDPQDSTSLSDNAVIALLEDHAGTLWIGTHGGLDRFDPETETFTHFRHDPQPDESEQRSGAGAL